MNTLDEEMTVFSDGVADEQDVANRNINFSETELDNDPHGCIFEIRKETNVWRRSVLAMGREIGIYNVISHELCQSLLANKDCQQFYTQLLMGRGVPVGPLQNLFANGMPTVDGPLHRRRRKPLSHPFGKPNIMSFQPKVRDFVRRELKTYLGQGTMNVATEFAKSAPPRLLCEIIGIPNSEQERFVELARLAALGLTLFPIEQLDEIDAASAELMDYVEQLLGRPPGERGTFLNVYLATAEAIEPPLSDDEIRVQLIDLLLASAETTRMTMTNAVSLLLSHPEQWEALKRNRDLVSGAVNETLRFQPSIGTCPRFAAKDIWVGDHFIPCGSIVSASLLGALRDPTKFAEPDRFNIQRTDFQRKHLAFGGGAHRCLGESLAWFEVYETIDALADMAPNMSLVGDPVICTGFSGMRRVTDCYINLS